MTTGELVESLRCYPPEGGPTLTPEQRVEVLEFASSFEECPYSREELQAMDDEGLIEAAYGAMADYARGQM